MKLDDNKKFYILIWIFIFFLFMISTWLTCQAQTGTDCDDFIREPSGQHSIARVIQNNYPVGNAVLTQAGLYITLPEFATPGTYFEPETHLSSHSGEPQIGLYLYEYMDHAIVQKNDSDPDKFALVRVHDGYSGKQPGQDYPHSMKVGYYEQGESISLIGHSEDANENNWIEFYTVGNFIDQFGTMFLHNCFTKDGNVGSPILNFSNANLVFGLQRKKRDEELCSNEAIMLSEYGVEIHEAMLKLLATPEYPHIIIYDAGHPNSTDEWNTPEAGMLHRPINNLDGCEQLAYSLWEFWEQKSRIIVPPGKWQTESGIKSGLVRYSCQIGKATINHGRANPIERTKTSKNNMKVQRTSKLKLEANPSPFNSEVLFSYFISKPQTVRISVYDITGRRIIDEEKYAQVGRNVFLWYPHNISSGIYLFGVHADNTFEYTKVVYLK